MKTSNKILVGVAVVTLAGIVMYASSAKQQKKTHRLNQIAEEGYETAGDILFPLKTRRKIWKSSY